MTVECLRLISDTLNSAGINYEFESWTSEVVPSPYFVGEYVEVESVNEDGLHESTFTLTGTTTSSWLSLEEAKETISNLFPSIGGKVESLSNGSTVAVFYGSAFPVPVDVMDIKRIQINLTIKEWMVK